MKEKLEKRFNLILACIIIAVLIAVAIPLSVNTIQTKTSDSEIETETTTVATSTATETQTQPPTELKIKTYIVGEKLQAEKPEPKEKIEKKTEPTSTEKATEKATDDSTETSVKKKTKPGFSYATAPTKSGVSYDVQWNAGYLVAIDNPDYGYHPPHVELSDKDRDLLERLCYGEFGDGGFTGAALVAQAVKDAMYTYGLNTVRDVINRFSYDGKTDHPGGQKIKDAVIYVFDMDKAAVQHRIIYMYDTAYVDSEFHETQNYVCTFKTTRFFDKK